MKQIELGELPKSTALDSLTKEEIALRYSLLEDEYLEALKEIYKLKNQNLTDDQLKLFMADYLQEMQDALYGASSERYKKPEKPKTPKVPEPRVKRPSERYPNIPVRENVITMNPAPNCQSCGKQMTDSGMTEDSEQLTVIPKKFEIVRNKRVKYRCTCHACIETAPNPPRIIEGSSYSDEMIQDVVISKYCDLIPVERYAAMAGRGGLMNLPPHSLIELTHGFADFVSGAYELLKTGVMQSRVLNADETPHRMLEGSLKKSWYLWGFSTPSLCFLECHDTRSGDVASEILIESKCEVLVTDVYSGYGKAIRITNVERLASKKVLIVNANCNAHARRYLFKVSDHYKDSHFYLDHYHEIYQLNSLSKGKSPPEVLAIRSAMKVRFEAMKAQALDQLPRYPAKNKFAKALSYFLDNYAGLTLFLDQADVPIDNNAQERLLRSHVVGRKTWYGTHSERGAKTAAILFSLVETCKLNGVNPIEYFKNLVEDLHAGRKPYTPKDFRDLRHD